MVKNLLFLKDFKITAKKIEHSGKMALSYNTPNSEFSYTNLTWMQTTSI